MQLAASWAERSLRQKEEPSNACAAGRFDLRFAGQKGVKTQTPFENGNCG